MRHEIVAVQLRREPDLVIARQRARQVAALLGFDAQDQVRIATAVSEVARNALMYAGAGSVRFALAGDAHGQAMAVTVSDAGPGIAGLDAILAGRYRSTTGLGLGLLGARRLMDRFEVATGAGPGTRVTLERRLPADASPVDQARIAAMSAELAWQAPRSPYEEIAEQNRDLAQSLAQLRERQEDLERLNRELEDTNRGVVALYAELDERAEGLRRADQAKTRFLSSITHELRTPLNSIRSLARMLLDRLDGPLTVEQEHQVRFIGNVAGDLNTLVDDLLDLAKIEAGKVTLRSEPFSLEAVWSALRGVMRPLQANPAVELVFEPAPPVELCTDEAKLAQILRNLLSNALKFTERGEVRIAAACEAETVVIAVSDTGIGIAPEHQAFVFEEFSQVESALQRRHKGTGLGLSLCRRLAGLLGGTLELDSVPGAGSTFRLRIPCRLAVGAEAGPAAGGPQGPLVPDESLLPDARLVPGARASASERSAVDVLLVDDDQALRYALRRRLEPQYVVHEAGDGDSGAAAVRSLHPSVLVLDLNMPGCGGEAMLQRLGPLDARLIVLTAAQLSAADRLRLEALGATILEKGDDTAEQLIQALASNPKSHS